jgi:predicted cytidylate kinase
METVHNTKHTKITIGGLSGTGKGTVAKMLAERLGFEAHSAGNFFREIAKERGYESLLALQQAVHHVDVMDSSVDEVVDSRTKQFGETHDRFVMEGRLCAHMIPQAFNILLTCNDEKRFGRIAKREGITEELAKAETLERENLYSNFYKQFYGIEAYNDPQYYDAVIDTSDILPDEIVEHIIAKLT